MENKYYLNNKGLITLLKGISTSIKNHTSESIIIDNDGIIENPNNLTTVKSIVNYLKNRGNLKISLDYSSPLGSSYDVETEVTNYNGEKEVDLDMKLIATSDIDNLF